VSVKIDITGQNKVISRLQSLGDTSTRALAAALYQEGEQLIAEAKQETPVDTGALRASGHVQQPTINGRQVEVVAGFGGVAAPYAVYVHEDLTKHHPVGNAKFLENPAKRRASGMADRVASRLEVFKR